MRRLGQFRMKRGIALSASVLLVFPCLTLALIQEHSKSANVDLQTRARNVELTSSQIPTSSPTPTNKEGGKGMQSVSEENLPKWLQMLKAGAEILAYVFAFLFFLYRTYVGYFISNLSLDIECKRCPGLTMPDAGATDYLSIIASIKKGDNGLLKLFVAEARVKSLNEDWERKKSFDIRRLDYDRARVIGLQGDAIIWHNQNTRKPYLQFPPGDTAQFACWFEVPSGNAYLIDIVILGRGKWPTIAISQWRASHVSLPDRVESGATEGMQRV